LRFEKPQLTNIELYFIVLFESRTFVRW